MRSLKVEGLEARACGGHAETLPPQNVIMKHILIGFTLHLFIYSNYFSALAIFIV